MQASEYKVSVIIPMYNSEDSIRECIDSLIRQTIGFGNIEVIIVDDGSSDSSLNICKGYARISENIKVFTQENAGPSVARNLGIKNATGKYIMYLDSDDTLSDTAIELVIDFFDKHYDEVDLVSYYDQYYKDGEPLKPHARYTYLQETGVYDLMSNPYIMQVRLNIAVKNNGEDNLLFKEDMDYQEDQFYCGQILSEKLKMGFVKEAQYNYLQRSSGLVGTNTNAIKMFKNTLMYFKTIFDMFEEVPEYYQVLFLHDLGWKLKQHCLYPYHYDEDKLQEAKDELASLLRKTDVNVILEHPTLEHFHKYYFLEFRNRNGIVVLPKEQQVQLICDGKIIHTEKKWDIIVFKIGVRNSKIHILGSFKSVYGSFICQPQILIEEKCKDIVVNEKYLDTFVSGDSYYRAREITNKFWGFDYTSEVDNIDSISIYVIIDGMKYKCSCWFMPHTGLSSKHKREFFVQNGYKISSINNDINIQKLSEDEEKALIEQRDKKETDPMFRYLIEASRKLSSKRIWLYYDCKGVRKDNGYYQFMNDINKNDGIDRYYITTSIENEQEFPDELKKYLVSFGSHEHKILFLAADLIITAFIEPYNYCPFLGNDFKLIADILKYKLVYLQHGILHATLPWKYTPDRELIDKIVVSSYFEKENFVNNYCFMKEDVISTGMARFNNMPNGKPLKKILFAPTWRQYLISQDCDGEWIKQPERFMKSKYFKEINKVLHSERLNKYLVQNEISLDIKLHPIFERYVDCFDKLPSNMQFIFVNNEASEYAMFITDFSSYVFDYVYLQRPIMYFVPDMEEFKAGMNQYRQLDLPFEKAFGELVIDAEAAVNEIIRVCQNKFSIDEKYQKRMDEFFVPLDNACDNLYRELIRCYVH